MFGCLRKVGCLIVILAAAAAVWYWYARVPSGGTRHASVAANAGWEPLSQTNADAGRREVESLSQRTGPVFANLTPSQAASYIFLVAAKTLPASAQKIEASSVDNRLRVRAEVALRELGGSSVLGPLAMLMGDRDTVEFGGSIHVLRPGAGEFTVDEMRVGQAPIPGVLIPRLVARFRKGSVEGVSDRGLPMKLPSYISDVRIQTGKVTLYKSVQ